MMVSCISGVQHIPPLDCFFFFYPRYEYILISAYFSVSIFQSRAGFSEIWTDWPQSKDIGLDFGCKMETEFQS